MKSGAKKGAPRMNVLERRLDVEQMRLKENEPLHLRLTELGEHQHENYIFVRKENQGIWVKKSPEAGAEFIAWRMIEECWRAQR